MRPFTEGGDGPGATEREPAGMEGGTPVHVARMSCLAGEGSVHTNVSSALQCLFLCRLGRFCFISAPKPVFVMRGSPRDRHYHSFPVRRQLSRFSLMSILQ